MAPRQRFSQAPSSDDLLPSPDKSDRPMLTAADSGVTSRSNSMESLAKCMPTEADIARDRHDIFNLVALVGVIGATFANIDVMVLLTGGGLADCWTGTYFAEYWLITALYFLADLVWVARVRICVKSPDVIIKHHLIALLYLIGPIAWPQYRWFMSGVMSVEISTWFLILRRVVYKRRDYMPKWFSDVVSLAFYLSWVAIRCYVYPAILMVFLQMADVEIRRTQTFMHIELLFIGMHLILCLLNLKWTYDLFKPIVKNLLVRDTTGCSVANGL